LDNIMAITPPTYTPSGSIFGTTPATTPYTYGNLGTSTSAYNIWGSKGNPYLIAGPTYTPGSGAPIVPRPIVPPVAPVSSGGSSDYVDTSGPSLKYGDDHPDAPYYNTPIYAPVFGALQGRIDTPGGGYARLPWYEGSAGGGYGYTEEGYDQYAPGDSDRGIYDADTGERTWGDEFDDYNTGDTWATTGLFEGLGNLARTGNWEGYIEPTYEAKPFAGTDRWATKSFASAPATTTTNTPATFSDYSVDAAIQEQQNIAAAHAQEARDAGISSEGDGGVTFSDGSSVSSLSDMSAGDTGSYSSAHSGDVGVTSYGDGQYGFTDADGTEVGWEDPGNESSSSSSDSGGGGGSYIATAATQALGEEGLKLFEDWRDYMFTALPTFTTSYGRYRVTAPKIVPKIDAEDISKELYKEIWDKHLKPIFDLIKEDKDNPKALSDYKIMVKELINKYLKGDK